MPCLSAPQMVVVTPLECQSMPITAPNAWNQTGSDRRRNSSALPCSTTIHLAISADSLTIRSNSQRGAWPWCRGRLAVPLRIEGLSVKGASSGTHATHRRTCCQLVVHHRDFGGGLEELCLSKPAYPPPSV